MKYNQAIDLENIIREHIEQDMNLTISTDNATYHIVPDLAGFDHAHVEISNADGEFLVVGDKITVTHGGYHMGDVVYVAIIVKTDCGKTIGNFRFFEPFIIRRS